MTCTCMCESTHTENIVDHPLKPDLNSPHQLIRFFFLMMCTVANIPLPELPDRKTTRHPK